MNGGLLAELVRLAREASPEECCGLLIGEDARIDAIWPARNSAERRTTQFLIDPRDHFEAIRAARTRGLEVVGFYHSHPHSAAIPSETDVAEATYPSYLSLIVGFVDGSPDVRLYRFADGNFLPVPLVTVA